MVNKILTVLPFFHSSNIFLSDGECSLHLSEVIKLIFSLFQYFLEGWGVFSLSVRGYLTCLFHSSLTLSLMFTILFHSLFTPPRIMKVIASHFG
jgi:hypothetical protein